MKFIAISRKEIFENKVFDMFGDIYDYLSEYINKESKIKIRHKYCGYEWNVRPQNLLAKVNQGKIVCPLCNNKVKYTNLTFQNRLDELTNSTYILVSDFKNIDTKATFKHLVCGHEWLVLPQTIIHGGRRCPKCSERMCYTNDQFQEKLNQINEEYILKSEYVNNRTQILVKHTVCNNVFEAIPASLLYSKYECPECYEKSASKGEKKIELYLIENNHKFTNQYTFEGCKDINKLRFDFALIKENIIILIEFDGGQHFKSVEWFGGEKAFAGVKSRDKIKNNFCIDNKIPLIRIPYWKYSEINEILDYLIKNILDKKEIDNNFKEFLKYA